MRIYLVWQSSVSLQPGWNPGPEIEWQCLSTENPETRFNFVAVSFATVCLVSQSVWMCGVARTGIYADYIFQVVNFHHITWGDSDARESYESVCCEKRMKSRMLHVARSWNPVQLAWWMEAMSSGPFRVIHVCVNSCVLHLMRRGVLRESRWLGIPSCL